MRGIAIEGAAQLIFVDTPGIFSPRRRLDRAMVATAWGSTHDADIVALLIDAHKGLHEDDEAILRTLGDVRSAKVLVLNKVDLVEKPALLTLTQTLNERMAFAATFMISARSGSGVADLKSFFAAHVPPGHGSIRRTRSPTRRCASLPPRSPAKSFFCDCIRNCPISRLSRPKSGRSSATAPCASSRPSMSSAKASAKSCSARAARRSRAIGAAARKDIAEAVEHPVHLFLFVKVREGWGDDPERYREMGLEFPKE